MAIGRMPGPLLLNGDSMSNTNEKIELGLLWTLPAGHPDSEEYGDSYSKGVIDVIKNAQTELILISPFLEPRGVRVLTNELLHAVARNVSITVLTHEADDLSSLASQSLEDLRREAERLGGSLTVYTAKKNKGVAQASMLIHAKLVIADRERVVIGSANLTGPGLSSNFEAGVILGPDAANEAVHMFEGLLEGGLARQAFQIEAKQT